MPRHLDGSTASTPSRRTRFESGAASRRARDDSSKELAGSGKAGSEWSSVGLDDGRVSSQSRPQPIARTHAESAARILNRDLMQCFQTRTANASASRTRPRGTLGVGAPERQSDHKPTPLAPASGYDPERLSSRSAANRSASAAVPRRHRAPRSKHGFRCARSVSRALALDRHRRPRRRPVPAECRPHP
jgi:hypothetical protein